MRLIVDWLNPVLAANMRLDQWVAPFGAFSNVRRTSRSIFSSPISRGAPGRGSSPSPAMPSAMKRLRQRPTVKPVVCNFAATAALLDPLAHARTILARNDADLELRDCRAIRSNSTRCTGFTTSSCFFGRPRRVSIPQLKTKLRYIQYIYDSGTRNLGVALVLRYGGRMNRLRLMVMVEYFANSPTCAFGDFACALGGANADVFAGNGSAFADIASGVEWAKCDKVARTFPNTLGRRSSSLGGAFADVSCAFPDVATWAAFMG